MIQKINLRILSKFNGRLWPQGTHTHIKSTGFHFNFRIIPKHKIFKILEAKLAKVSILPSEV